MPGEARRQATASRGEGASGRGGRGSIVRVGWCRAVVETRSATWSQTADGAVERCESCKGASIEVGNRVKFKYEEGGRWR